jgi:PAS domain S-box-containing protein
VTFEMPSPRPAVLGGAAVLVGALYWICAKFGLAFPTDESRIVTLLWLPMGIALVACGWSSWMVLGILPGVMAVELGLKLPVWAAIGISAGSTLAPWLASRWLLRVGVSASGLEPEDMRRYVLACAGAALMTSANGATWIYLVGVTNSGNALTEWGRWWMGDFLGALLVVATCWPYCARRNLPDLSKLRKFDPLPVLSYLSISMAAVGLGLLVMVNNRNLAGPVLLFLALPIVWSAMLWGALPTYLTVAVVAWGSAFATSQGWGPFFVDGFEGSDLMLWTYIAGLLMLAMVTLALRQRFEQQTVALGESEERFRTLVENSNAGVAVTEDGRFTYVNAAYAAMLQYRPEELLGKHFYEVTDPQDRELNEHFRQEHLRAPSGYKRTEFEKRYLRKDGSVVWGRVVFARIPDAATRQNSFVAIVIDLTRARERELEWKLKSEQLQLVLDAANAGVWDWSADSQTTYFSPELKKLLGYAVDQTIDPRDLESRLHPEDASRVLQARARLLQDGLPMGQEFRVRHVQEHYIWVRALGGIRREAGGRVNRFFGSVVDITSHRQSRSEREARLLAEESSRAKSDFLSRISHELRTPLNAILGFTQLLQLDQRQALTPQQRQWVNHVNESGQHLLNLIDDLLNLTRFEKGQMQITLGTVGLQRILDRVHSLLELDAANAQVELDLKLDPVHQNAAVLADDLKLTQVLTNLVMNAIKYNRIDGQVSVTLEQHEASWALAIRDTGMGFTPEQALRMFEPFNRLGLEKSTIEGTGIGLALAKRLVEAMDGRLSATATPGQGAVFTVELPLPPLQPFIALRNKRQACQPHRQQAIPHLCTKH